MNVAHSPYLRIAIPMSNSGPSLAQFLFRGPPEREHAVKQSASEGSSAS